MEMLVANFIAVQDFIRKISTAYCRDPQSPSLDTQFLNFWALICNNSGNSIQSDSLTSTSLSRTANDQAHRHFEAAELGTGQKLEGGEGWCKDGEGHGFSCKHKREGQTIWCMSLRGGHYFLCKDAGVKESIYKSSLVTVILL